MYSGSPYGPCFVGVLDLPVFLVAFIGFRGFYASFARC